MGAVSIARTRVSITGTFFLHGAVFTSWYARLPAIQERLDLTPGQLGIALFGAPAGLLVAQPAIGALAARTGSRPIVAAAPLYIGAVMLPALAVDTVTLLLALVLVGAASGVLDIAMNAQGLAVERASGRHLFSSLHAAFSFGALAGAAAAASAAGVAALPFLAASALVGRGARAGATPRPGRCRCAAVRPAESPARRAGRDRVLRAAGRRGGLRLEQHLPRYPGEDHR
jgi:MFS family permease